MSYVPRHPDFDHQAKFHTLHGDKEYVALICEQGTGKTKITIDNIARLHTAGVLDGALIVAPNGVHLNWTRVEIPKHGPAFFKTLEWRGSQTPKQRAALAAQIAAPAPGRCVILVMHIESMRTEDGVRTANAFLASRRCLFAIDESTTIKNPKAIQTKVVSKLGGLAKFRRILTGTPMAKDPLDFFSQYRFLSLSILPWTSFTAFKAMFAVVVSQKMGPRSFDKIVGFRNLDLLTKALAPHTYRVLKKDCLDLPEKVYRTRFVPFPPEQNQRYKELKNRGILELQQEQARTGVVSATSVLALFNKLRQFTLGFVIDDEGVIHEVPTNRYDALWDELEPLDATGAKAIIFTHYKESIRQVVARLRQRYGDASTVAYFGETRDEDRHLAVQRFQDDSGTRFLVCNRTAAYGLTLTAAQSMFFFGNDSKMDVRLQMEDRIHRSGQTGTCVYTDFITPGSIDTRIAAILQGKLQMNESIMLTDWHKLFAEDEEENPFNE